MSMSNASRSANINGTKSSQDKHLWPMVHAMQRPITLDRPTEKSVGDGKVFKKHSPVMLYFAATESIAYTNRELMRSSR